MAWLSGWNYRKKITIQNANVDSNLTDFPLYVDITSDGDIGTNISDSTNGYDIRFTDSGGQTLLKYEREYFNVATSVATGDYWVKCAPTAASSTDIYIYYNDGDGTVDGEDAANVWDANFVGVWHLVEVGDGTADEFVDSSGTNHGRGGEGGGSNVPTQINGQIYKGQDFNEDWVKVDADASFNVNTATAEVWAKRDNSYAGAQGLISTHYNNWDMHMQTTEVAAYVDDTHTGSSGTISDTVFSHCVLTITPGDVELFLDGASVATNTQTAATASSTLYMGRTQWSATDDFPGAIDEARVSDIVRSDAWIKFTAFNIKEADNELTWASEESAPSTFIPKVIMIN